MTMKWKSEVSGFPPIIYSKPWIVADYLVIKRYSLLQSCFWNNETNFFNFFRPLFFHVIWMVNQKLGDMEIHRTIFFLTWSLFSPIFSGFVLFPFFSPFIFLYSVFLLLCVPFSSVIPLLFISFFGDRTTFHIRRQIWHLANTLYIKKM